MTELTLIIGNKNYSSWSLRPWLVMRQFGLEFGEIRIPLYTPEAAEKIRQYSPAGKVPVLVHGEVAVWDSLAICEYLAEQFPGGHWPENSAVRAIARAISAEMHSGFLDLRQNMPMNCRAHYPGKGMTVAVQKDIDRITTIWRECRQMVGAVGQGATTSSVTGQMLFGEFTIADAMFAPVVLRFKTYGVPLDPISQAYSEAILALPAMQEWLSAAIAETETIPKYELS
jgi:glutathione S-transferase